MRYYLIKDNNPTVLLSTAYKCISALLSPSSYCFALAIGHFHTTAEVPREAGSAADCLSQKGPRIVVDG